ncbi:hypothetical protein [Alteraurantiacibacter aquimixticola]|uniref:SIR2-like domain-containing protein n=1 Tax=Alteraurantiacibacter aquimixticola TaxID=2489173 RepID=A0A4T3F425_9SPHN|nr:hypothetical protein [Alteraurantiacibacter aquimixticola]TIX52013.1 hypothetical protein E5222_06195 [Alteraurantiacibacter aquimixticola]
MSRNTGAHRPMIRTKTALVVGPGAAGEIDLPDAREMLGRTVQALDFRRLGSDLETDDMKTLAARIEAYAIETKVKHHELMEAAEKVRTAARIADSIDLVLEQLAHDPHASSVIKLAIATFTLQAESRCSLQAEPMVEGDLPLRGSENWLFQVGRIITNGVPRDEAARCLENLVIVSFNRDRSLEHFLPHMIGMAFGMTLVEARELVSERLNITHPLGVAGHLPWATGKGGVEWGETEPSDLKQLVASIDSASERKEHKEYLAGLRQTIAASPRIVFLGFDFHPQDVEFLFDQPLERQPDVLGTACAMSEAMEDAITRMLQDRAALRPDRLGLLDMRCFELLREFNLFLES